jgi:hypothetical protein
MVALVPLFLVACGSESGLKEGQATTPPVSEPIPVAAVPKKEKAAPTSMYIASKDKLPKCEDANEGQLVYIKADKHFQACTRGTWEVVDVKGEKGEKGDKGDAGAAGAAGKDASAVVTRNVYCSRMDSAGIEILYDATEFENGNLFVRCSVSTGSREHSVSDLFGAGSMGAMTAPCSIGHDLDSSGFGWIDFELGSTRSAPASYTIKDVGHVRHNQKVTFAESECQLTEY